MALGSNKESSGFRITEALHRRFVISWWAMTSLLLPIAFWTYSVSPLLSDNYLYDAWLSSRSSPPSQDILIVEIDEPSLQWLGRWPWPRDIHAQLIEKLHTAGASAIVLDILLTEPSREPEQDARLVQAMASHGNVYLPLALLPERASGAPFRDILMPAPTLMEAAKAVGHINVSLDRDGVAREVLLREFRDGQDWPQLMVSVAGIDPGTLSKTPVRIPYRGWPKHYPSVSYYDVLENRLPDSFLEGRIVLVGMTALGMGDRYNMSLLSRELMPGVEVHAHLLDALRDDNLIHKTNPMLGALLAGLPIVLLMLLTWWLRFRYMLATVLTLSAGAVSASLIALSAGWWWPPSASLIALGLAFVVIIWRSQATLLAWFEQELKLLYREPPILPFQDQKALVREGGKLYQQLQSLEFALNRLVQGRRFILDVMHSLPLPIFILDEGGNVLLANSKAAMLKDQSGSKAPLDHISSLPERVSFEDPQGFSTVWPPEMFSSDETLKTVSGGLCIDGESSTYRLEMGRLTTPTSLVGGGWLVWLVDLTSEVAIEAQRASMLSFLSHDMKAPQTRALALLDAQRESKNPQPTSRFYEQLEQSLRTSLGMINDFISLTRAKSFAFEHEFLLLEDLAMEVLDQVRPLARSKQIQVFSEFNDEDGSPVLGDKGYLARAVFNLVENAVKYGYEQGEVKVRVTANAEWVILDVEDNGVGISADEIDKVFEDYHRSDTGNVAKGHGLGLALVKAVAEKHGGSVTCKSELGKGSQFTLMLPACPLD
ncbi:CHASE2 domain-containing protein [Vreelandella aquamarina]